MTRANADHTAHVRRVTALYRDASWPTRWYAALRAHYYPLETYLAWLPEAGRIADVGCGRGVLASRCWRSRGRARR